MTDRLEEIFGDCSVEDIGSEPETCEQFWLDRVRLSVCTLGIHAWSEHMAAGGLHEGRSVADCSRTVRQAIEEVI